MTSLPNNGWRLALPRVLPFAFYIVILALRGLDSSGLGFLASPWMYVCQIAAAVLVLLYYRKTYSELRSWRQLKLPEVLLALGAGVLVFAAWIQLDVPVLSLNAGKAASSLPMPAHGSVVWIVFRVLGAALVVPVMEELFWRSFLLRWLTARNFLSVTPASMHLTTLLAGSLAFGLEHELWFAGWLAGLVYAWLYRRGSLHYAILAHGVTNACLAIWVLATQQWQFW